MPRKRSAPDVEGAPQKESVTKKARVSVKKVEEEAIKNAGEAVVVPATRRSSSRRGRVNEGESKHGDEPRTTKKASKKTALTARRTKEPKDTNKAEVSSLPKRGKSKPKATATAAATTTSAVDKAANADANANANATNASTGDAPRPWFWLMKAEPESRIEKGVDVKFSIDDLASRTEPEKWDGVRNYVARNNMRAMKKGEQAFFYHSNCKVPGIVGIMEIVGEAEDDESAFDEKHPYYDPKSKRDNPKWSVVRVQFVRKFDRIISLPELRTHQNGELKEMPLLRMGRLSVSRVGKKEWDFILGLEELKTES